MMIMRKDTGRLAMTTSFRTITLRATAVAMFTLLAACQTDKVEIAEENDVYSDSLQISDFANILQTVPDEFSVVTKRPLELPDNFAALPVPEPGKVSTREPNPQADARAALSFEPVPAATGTGGPSAAEAAILSSAGAADPAIREKIASDQAQYEAENAQYILDRVFPRLREVREGDTNIINAEEERLRLLEEGITPRATRSGATPPIPGSAAALPQPPTPVPAPATTTAVVPATPVNPGTGPVLVAPEPRAVPTLGVLTPEPTTITQPSLIYLPE